MTHSLRLLAALVARVGVLLAHAAVVTPVLWRLWVVMATAGASALRCVRGAHFARLPWRVGVSGRRRLLRCGVRIEGSGEVGAVKPAQRVENGSLIVALIPEKVFALGELLFLRVGAIGGFESVGVYAGVIDFSGNRHGCGGEVLHLLKMKVQVFGDDGKLSHSLLGAARVR